MLGDSSRLLATSTTPSTAAAGGGGGGGGGGDAPAPTHQLPTSGGGGGGAQESSRSEVGHVGPSNNNSGEDDRRAAGGDEGDRSFGGNRWPRQETLALLKIRSDMDVAFRDASVKGPLWDEVSRKLAELGYNRSAKKCKEKFENVFKYHKRTKEGRSGKHEGKTYRFFDQLEAFESHTSTQSQPPPHSLPAPATALPMPQVSTAAPPHHPSATAITIPSTIAATATSQGIATTAINLAIPNPIILPFSQATMTTNPTNLNQSQPNIQSNFSSHLPSDSTSSSTSSDMEGRGRRKRKWGEFFERLMKEVIHKQEDMHKRFLEAIEKREHDRMVREEAWRMQEMARINREREILAQERSIAAAKDAAVMAFLQKLSEQQNPAAGQQQIPVNPSPPPPQPSVQTQPQQQPQPQIQQEIPPLATPGPIAQALPVTVVAAAQPQAGVLNLETKSDNGDQSLMAASSSRWPKVEVETLINLRTNLESKYQENGPKGPLWEEISAGMRKFGYNRNAKRCKEKWENINKYFKKVKESNKKRPEDSKTCPYFHQLDALYKEKHKTEGMATSNPSSSSNIQVMKPDHHHQINSVPLMVQPEQQWPPAPAPPPSHHQQQQPPPQGHHHGSVMDDLESDDNQNDDPDDDDDKDMDDDEEDEASGYEIVANSNRPTSVSSAG